MPKRDIIVIGASAGGIEALKELVAALPKDFAASLFIVQHIAPQSPGVLPDILTRYGNLYAANARNGEPIEKGRIYVAPADHHLLVEATGYARVTRGPKENRFRPAVDPLFRSAAHAFGWRVIGVILTGGLDDGAAGLAAIKERGGAAIVQNPAEALAPSMPLNALAHVSVDYCVPLAAIAPLLLRLIDEEVVEEGEKPMPEELEIEVAIAREERGKLGGVMKLGELSPFTCPECHGTLIQMRGENPLRFRCHTGHAFSVNSLLAELSESVEESLWNAIRSIEESAMLMRHLAVHLTEHNQKQAPEMLLEKAQEAQKRADVVRQAVMQHDKLNEEEMQQMGANQG